MELVASVPGNGSLPVVSFTQTAGKMIKLCQAADEGSHYKMLLHKKIFLA